MDKVGMGILAFRLVHPAQVLQSLFRHNETVVPGAGQVVDSGLGHIRHQLIVLVVVGVEIGVKMVGSSVWCCAPEYPRGIELL